MAEEHIRIVKKFLSALEQFCDQEEVFAEVLHPEFQQKEFPNLLNKSGQESDFYHAVERAGKAKNILSRQVYQITNIVSDADQIVAELRWEGWMAIDAGPLKQGQKVTAYICVVIEFKDGKIYRQRNYDCFDSFN